MGIDPDLLEKYLTVSLALFEQKLGSEQYNEFIKMRDLDPDRFSKLLEEFIDQNFEEILIHFEEYIKTVKQ